MDYRFIDSKSKVDCCGCEACSYVCPQSIIMMQEDDEGFVYPVVINEESCISCGACKKVCPIDNPLKADGKINDFCSGYLLNEDDIRLSASGGLATAVSKQFLEKYNGVVYGVSYSDDFKSIRYERATTIQQLEKFRGSKYVQARKSVDAIRNSIIYDGGSVYDLILGDLKRGLYVLFIGLPCEVAALVKLTNYKYDKLFTMELVCHGPTSQKVHREYIDMIQKDNNANVLSFTVRYKYTGWKPYFIKAVFSDKLNSIHIENFHKSNYGIAFRYLKRPSCSQCIFKYRNERSGLHADITLGDFHYAGKSHIAWNEWGSSVGYIHTHKGEKLIDICKSSFCFKETNPLHALKSSYAFEHAIPLRFNRKSFSKTFISKSLDAACSLPSVYMIDRIEEMKRKIFAFLVKARNSILK